MIDKLTPEQKDHARKMALLAADQIPQGATSRELRFLGEGGNLGLPGDRLLMAIWVIVLENR